MRMTTSKLATITCALALALSLAACGKKDDASKDEPAETPIIVEDAAADDQTAETDTEPEPAEEPAEEEGGETVVTPVRRAGGPLAVVADDELCSILVIGTGQGPDGFVYGLEITNNTDEALVASAQDGSFSADGSPVSASFSAQVAAGETVEANLTLPYTDALPDADAFAQAALAGELVVAGASDPTTPQATYAVAIN